MGLSFWKDSIQVYHCTNASKNGGQYATYSSEAVTIDYVQVTAQASERDFEGRLLNIADKRLVRANYDADIREDDLVVYDGETYQVDGEVFHTKSPTGRASSTRCTIKRWTG